MFKSLKSVIRSFVMKKSILILTFLISLSTTQIAHAGFWGSVVGGAIGSSSSSSSPSRMKKVNTYLWDMHKEGKLEDGYQFYLQYLEKSDNLDYLDTVAWIYYDSGNKKKAIEIYKKRILPWAAIEDESEKERWKKNYEKLKNS